MSLEGRYRPVAKEPNTHTCADTASCKQRQSTAQVVLLVVVTSTCKYHDEILAGMGRYDM